MESQHQNPEFRINPENFHLCNYGNHFKISNKFFVLFSNKMLVIKA